MNFKRKLIAYTHNGFLYPPPIGSFSSTTIMTPFPLYLCFSICKHYFSFMRNFMMLLSELWASKNNFVILINDTDEKVNSLLTVPVFANR